MAYGFGKVRTAVTGSAPDVFAASGQTTRKGVEFDLHYQLGSAFSTYLSYGRLLRARLSVPEHT